MGPFHQIMVIKVLLMVLIGVNMHLICTDSDFISCLLCTEKCHFIVLLYSIFRFHVILLVNTMVLICVDLYYFVSNIHFGIKMSFGIDFA